MDTENEKENNAFKTTFFFRFLPMMVPFLTNERSFT